MKPIYLNPVTKIIAENLLEAMNQSYPNHQQDLDSIISQFGPTPNPKAGHLAFPCFSLAKNCKESPVNIAQNLIAELNKQAVKHFNNVEMKGPYLNFFFDFQTVGDNYISPLLNDHILNKPLFSSTEKWMFEYCQPNTHKVLHVGHMRNLCLGNALINIYRYAGLETISVTYPGDVGTHVAKCLWYLENHCPKPWPTDKKGEWLGEVYTLANSLLENEKGTDKEEKNRESLTKILHELKEQNGPFFELWKETREWSLDHMKEVYHWANVEYDRWFFESEVDAPSLKYMEKLYQDGSLEKDQGAIGMKLEEEKLGFCMLVKSDGTGLYATKDVELARLKFEEYKVDHSIYVVDDRQSHHFKQVFKVLEKIGFDQAKNCFHLPYAMVELPGGGMSSRTGNIITLAELIQKMEGHIFDHYLKKYTDGTAESWTEEEIEKTCRQIANAAIKYGMLRVDNNRKITFDMKEALKLEGETGPYLQYVCVRAKAVAEKVSHCELTEINWNALQLEQEQYLMAKLIEFHDVIKSSVSKLQTLNLCAYLYELAKAYNSFYANCPIKNEANRECQNARLALNNAVVKTIEQGLKLLGIEVPHKM